MNHSVARVVILILILVLWIYQTHFLILLLFNIDAKKLSCLADYALRDSLTEKG